MNRLLLAIVLLSLLACKKGGEAGASCASDADCKNGFRCVSGACVARATGEPTGTSTAGWSVGNQVMVEWKGSWYEATILEVQAGSRYKIHYDGWDSSWDEVVGTDRIKARPAGGQGTVSLGAPPGATRAEPPKAAANAPKTNSKNGAKCTTHSQCGGLKCCFFGGPTGKICSASCGEATEACTSDRDCRKGWACATEEGFCSPQAADPTATQPVAPPKAGKKANQTCATSSECAAGLKCCDLTGVGDIDRPVCRADCMGMSQL